MRLPANLNIKKYIRELIFSFWIYFCLTILFEYWFEDKINYLHAFISSLIFSILYTLVKDKLKSKKNNDPKN